MMPTARAALVVVMWMTVHDSSSRLVAVMAMSTVGAVSGCGSACGGSLACCGRYWPSYLLVLAMIIVGFRWPFLADGDLAFGVTAGVAAGFGCR